MAAVASASVENSMKAKPLEVPASSWGISSPFSAMAPTCEKNLRMTLESLSYFSLGTIGKPSTMITCLMDVSICGSSSSKVPPSLSSSSSSSPLNRLCLSSTTCCFTC